MPRVYDAAGLSSAAGQNALQVLVWGCTSLATFFGFMRFADSVPRRTLYVIGAVMGIVAWALLSYAPPRLPVLIAFAVIWGTSAGIGAQAFYSVWTSELFATRLRATAQGVLFFAARCAVGGLSYVFPTLLTQQGVPFVGTIMLASLLVALVVGAVWAPGHPGQVAARDRAGALPGAGRQRAEPGPTGRRGARHELGSEDAPLVQVVLVDGLREQQLRGRAAELLAGLPDRGERDRGRRGELDVVVPHDGEVRTAPATRRRWRAAAGRAR